jgi:hypothetical protein
MRVTRIGKMFNHKDQDGVPQPGVFPVSRAKGYRDFVLTDPSNPCIPGTDIPRLRLTYLGPKSVGVDDEEKHRVIEALKELHAAKIEERIGKKKNPPALADPEEAAS